ncbi:uncharacterized protein [Elaeis guineensis]|uniref:Uncharacterized protein LOC105051285 isoform X1 n=1 Tax=Elaeis guineensis var. tenera TaxID=51953 RepID=A0A8N4IFG2_ELAGV|nr:uncharacterized protein LOC105051285 isoform X1 [Elaeis guineensis]
MMELNIPPPLRIRSSLHPRSAPRHLLPLDLRKLPLSLDSRLFRSPRRVCLFRRWSLGGGGVGFGMDGGRATADATSGRMVFEPILEEGVFRFDCSGNDRDAAFPSISFVDPKARETPIMVHKVPEYIPMFQRIYGQQIVKIQLPSGSSFYGTGEVSGQLERTGKRVDLREDFTIKFVAMGVYPVITFGPFETPTDVLMSLSHAIGTIFMPPKWSLGYHQCHWSYDSAAKVLKVARTFREKHIPCDVIWMDIDFMDGFRCFTFDKAYDVADMKRIRCLYHSSSG